jgi:hypothetical protein
MASTQPIRMEPWKPDSAAFDNDIEMLGDVLHGITILAWWLLASCAFLPLNILIHSPAVVFTKLLTSQSAGLWYCALVAIQLFIGYGLLRLRPFVPPPRGVWFTSRPSKLLPETLSASSGRSNGRSQRAIAARRS